MLQIKEMTKGEKIKMYEIVDKAQLIEMLIEANNHLDRLTKPFSAYRLGDLQSINGVTFDSEEMMDLITHFDLYETDEDEGVGVALTNYESGKPYPDCGKFYLNADNTYTFKLY